jgi:hypothetical protein
MHTSDQDITRLEVRINHQAKMPEVSVIQGVLWRIEEVLKSMISAEKTEIIQKFAKQYTVADRVHHIFHVDQVIFDYHIALYQKNEGTGYLLRVEYKFSSATGTAISRMINYSLADRISYDNIVRRINHLVWIEKPGDHSHAKGGIVSELNHFSKPVSLADVVGHTSSK